MKISRFLLPFSALLLTVLLLFTGCSAKYKDNYPAEEVTKAITAQVTVSSGYLPCDPDFMQFYLPDAVKPVDDYSIVYASAANDYTEVGVLHVKDKKDLETVEAAVQDYLDEFRTTYEPQAQQYDQTEQQKLKDASYKVYGKYIVYMIMTAEQQEICDGIIEELLKAEETA